MKKNISRKLHLALNFLCGLLIVLILLMPNNLSEMEWPMFVALPLEALILGLGLLLRGRAGILLRRAAAVILAIGIILKIADIAVYQIFARPFNPVLDAFFISNGMNLLNGSLGYLGALGVAVLLVVSILGIIALSFWLLRRLQQQLHSAPKVSLSVLLLGIAVWAFIWISGAQGAAKTFYDQLFEHVNATYRSYAELKQFKLVLEVDPIVAKTPRGNLFNKLKGKDILLVFIESYGRIVLDKPEFAQHVRPVLQQGSNDLAGHGIGARSAYLTSSTMGGLSWLAHGTALSGLWINSQERYDSLIMSQRPSLNRLFKNAGWRTTAVEPAITTQWPEGDYFGYDKIYTANELGYKGLPFSWITMPDQYTLSAFQKFERNAEHKPVMTEMALISSHAPWTPLPSHVNWNDVGDGSIFNAQAKAGDSPDVVWRDNNRIRIQFRKSIEYTLANLVSYATQYGDDNLVIIAFGDHQPAPLVTGDTDNRDVIIHLIARDPKILDAVKDWQWTEGMLPAENAPVWKMDELRPRLIETFSSAE
jgi:phosphoglycerol transferase MdoB-like AlkP superfamily enzyme